MAEFKGLILQKSGDKVNATVGDMITYTLTATNKELIALNHVIIYDTLPAELEFVAHSVVVDGLRLVEDNILSGVNIGLLEPGGERVISFQAKVLLEGKEKVGNFATAQFTYQFIGKTVQQMEVNSNVFYIDIYSAQIQVVKTADKDKVLLEDKLKYKVILTNTGDLTAYNIVFKDFLPPQMRLVPGSFKINGVVVNGVELNKGVMVGTIVEGGTLTLRYQVEILGSNCSGMLKNSAQVMFQYELPDGTLGNRVDMGAQSAVETEVAITTFKQMSIESYLVIPEAKPNIEDINSMTGSIDVTSWHVIETPVVGSREGQKLTGYKLIVRGNLNIVNEYTALDTEQSVHSAQYSIPFSTFVVLPPDYRIGSKMEVTGIVEDIYYKMVDIRNFFTNTTMLINVAILSC